MKKYYIYIFLLVSIGMHSCKKTDYLLYNSEQINRLTFVQDTLRFSYGMLLDKDVDLLIRTKLIGLVNVNENTPFTLSVNKDKSTAIAGTHYTLPAENRLLKDSTEATIPLDFLKENLDFDKDYVLTLDLLNNDYFQATDITRCVVIFGNKSIPAPIWWRGDRLGDYNQDKFVLFVSHYSDTKDVSSYLYTKIKNSWGEHLTGGTAINLLTISEYREYIKRYILIPMYDHYLDTNDEKYKIPNPNL